MNRELAFSLSGLLLILSSLLEVAIDNVKSLLSRLDVLLVGPGLGRNRFMLKLAEAIMKECDIKGIGLVVDAVNLLCI